MSQQSITDDERRNRLRDNAVIAEHHEPQSDSGCGLLVDFWSGELHPVVHEQRQTGSVLYQKDERED